MLLAGSYPEKVRAAVAGAGHHFGYRMTEAEMENYVANRNRRASYIFGAPGDGPSFPETTIEKEEELFERWSLSELDLVEKIVCPVLMINGKQDHLAPIGNIYYMIEHGPVTGKEARIYPDDGHCAFKYFEQWVPRIFPLAEGEADDGVMKPPSPALKNPLILDHGKNNRRHQRFTRRPDGFNANRRLWVIGRHHDFQNATRRQWDDSLRYDDVLRPAAGILAQLDIGIHHILAIDAQPQVKTTQGAFTFSANLGRSDYQIGSSLTHRDFIVFHGDAVGRIRYIHFNDRRGLAWALGDGRRRLKILSGIRHNHGRQEDNQCGDNLFHDLFSSLRKNREWYGRFDEPHPSADDLERRFLTSSPIQDALGRCRAFLRVFSYIMEYIIQM